MFDHTVKYFGFLKHVPVLPHAFDAMLKTTKLFSGSKIPFIIDDIEEEVLSWKGTSARLHKFGGLQFDVNGKEIGHIHGNGLLDILFNRETKSKLITEKRVVEHHIFKNSGWISFYIKSPEQKAEAVRLLRESYDQKVK
jgi:hypothetical protein